MIFVIPAQAGIQGFQRQSGATRRFFHALGPRLRGDDVRSST